MKITKLLFITPVIACILLFLAQSAFALTPTGCELYQTGVIRCWNQNPTYENVTFITTDGSQFANTHLDRFNWTDYEMGVFYKHPTNGILRFPFSMRASSLKYDSDNSTYWSLRWKGKQINGTKALYYTYWMNQSIYDEYVNMTLQVQLENLTNFLYNLSFYRIMRNTDIWNDNHTEYLNLVNGSEYYGYPLNNSGVLYFDNIENWLTLASSNPRGAVRWEFGDGYTAVIIPTSGVNNNVGFYKEKSGPYPEDRIYSITNYWMDIDPCTISCQVGASLNLQHLDDGAGPYDQLDYNQNYCKVWVTSFGGATCTATATCFMKLVENTDGVGFPLKKKFCPARRNDYYQAWNTVDEPSVLNISGTITSTPIYISTNLSATHPSLATTRCYIDEAGDQCVARGLSSFYTPIVARYVDRTLEFNITLEGPPNGTSYDAGETIPFQYAGLTNVSMFWNWAALYVNNTLYDNYSTDSRDQLTWWPNKTVNLNNFTDPGLYYWDILVSSPLNDSANYSWNGNFTVEVNASVQPPILTQEPAYFGKTRRSSRYDLAEWILLGMYVLLVAVLMVIVHKKSDLFKDET